MKYRVSLGGKTWEIAVSAGKVSVEGKEYQAELRSIEGTPVRVLSLNGGTWAFPLESAGAGNWTVLVHGERHELEALDERTAHIRLLGGTAVAATGPAVLKAPMPGLVVRVLAEPGQKVVEGTSLIVLEAMKMENELKAAKSGLIETVAVSRGQTVEKGQVLLTFAVAAR